MTFPGVNTGAGAGPPPVGWFWVVAQPDSFLESLSTGATTRSPLLPVRVPPIDWTTQQSYKKACGKEKKGTVTMMLF